ncbi:MAG: hypothetical protein L0209_06245 [candidate division Zixibacteria bacterium]|nr:hypothetical protein [candidate division Zixibacteria bacterium]
MKRLMLSTLMIAGTVIPVQSQPLVDHLLSMAAGTYFPWNTYLKVEETQFIDRGKTTDDNDRSWRVIAVYAEFDNWAADKVIQDSIDYALRIAPPTTRKDSISRFEMLNVGAYLMKENFKDQWLLALLNFIRECQKSDGNNKLPYCLFQRMFDKQSNQYFKATIIGNLTLYSPLKSMKDVKTTKALRMTRTVTADGFWFSKQ